MGYPINTTTMVGVRLRGMRSSGLELGGSALLATPHHRNSRLMHAMPRYDCRAANRRPRAHILVAQERRRLIVSISNRARCALCIIDTHLWRILFDLTRQQNIVGGPNGAACCGIGNCLVSDGQLICLQGMRLHHTAPQQLREFAGYHRMTEVKTLRLGASVLAQEVKLLSRFHPFGHDQHV
jgi:hypothetical protein